MSASTRRLRAGLTLKTAAIAGVKKLLRATIEIGVVLVLACILSGMPCADAGAAKKRCVSDPKLTLDKYLELSSDHDNWHMAVFGRVPKGLTIAATSKSYVIMEPTQERVLPSEAADTLAGLRPYYEFKPRCLVQDPRGQWWLVYQTGKHFLTYVPASAAEEGPVW
jgi:hypothetical protein